MDNVVQLNPIPDADVERAINILYAVEIGALPANVQGALQQLAVKILRSSV